MNPTNPPAPLFHRCRTSPGALLTTAVIAAFLGFIIGHGVGRDRSNSPYDGSLSAPAGDIAPVAPAPSAGTKNQ